MFVTVSTNSYLYIHSQRFIRHKSKQTHQLHADLDRSPSEHCESTLDTAFNESAKKDKDLKIQLASSTTGNIRGLLVFNIEYGDKALKSTWKGSTKMSNKHLLKFKTS